MSRKDERNGSSGKADASGYEGRLAVLETKMAMIEAVLSQKPQQPKSNASEEAIIDNIDKIGVQHLAVICLRLRGPQTREQLKGAVESWGKAHGDWFSGGNMRKRLIKTRIVMASAKDENGKVTYSLTRKGERVADELIEKYTHKDTASSRSVR